jgi:hypothetical protein
MKVLMLVWVFFSNHSLTMQHIEFKSLENCRSAEGTIRAQSPAAEMSSVRVDTHCVVVAD